MTDMHIEQAAAPVEKPLEIRTELLNLLSVVDGNVAITREQMDAIGSELGVLWDKAHAVGDNDALTTINDLWERTRILADQNASLAFQVTGMGSIASSALEGERATREALDTREAELGDLTDAITAVDETHPLLKEFSDTIRVDAEEEFDTRLQEEIVPELFEAAYEEQNGYLVSMIVEMTGCSEGAAEIFIEVLDNSHSPNDEQLALLKATLDSFEVTAQVRHANRLANRIKDRQEVAIELQEWNDNGY